MKLSKTIAVLTMIAPLVVGCASSTYESNNNNTHVLNNNNPGIDGSASGCITTCTGDNVCVGQPNHQSCVPTCEEGLTCADPLRTCCYGGCVDLQNDPNNCGSCAEFCDGNCINGVCVDPCGNMCTADQTCCGGTCTNTMTDMANCGACGEPCDAEASDACVNGSCKCGTTTCDVGSGAECCPTGCKYVATDVTNCGGCNLACSIGETCDGGNCLCGTGPACTGTQGCCNQSCVDLNSAQYCGSCTVSCGNNEECFSGTCGCGAAGTTCGNDILGNPIECCGASGCVVMNNIIAIGINNCGTCGINCPFGVPCILGACDAS